MAAKQTLPVPKGLPQVRKIAVDNLLLDPMNPRLAGLNLTVDQQDEILRILWRERAVNELVDSVAKSGYWEHEELFAAKESGKLIVIEGNRRLAAVKLLLDGDLCARVGATGVPAISSEARSQLGELPVIECSRQELWQYIGFKHVNGPQDWDSIAKAQYIARVHNEYGVELPEIAATIGDRHDTVRRLYRGLMVLEQAESKGVFDRRDCYNTRFAYSHLWTGLGYAGFQEFLGLTAERGYKPNPVPAKKIDNLKELCLWLYGSKEQEKTPVIRSQNPDLRNLDEVLRSLNGLAALRSGLPLETCLKASRGDERLLREALVLAEQKLKEGRGLVLTGYRGDPDLLKKAGIIATLAESIVKDMQEKDSSASGTATGKGKRRG